MEATGAKHPYQGMIVRGISRAPRAAVAAIAQTYTGFVLDRLGKYGAMHIALKPLVPGMRLCGTAVTSLGPDLSVRRMAINLAEPGDVLVVAAGGGTDYACFGDGTATRMRLKGIAGAVIDGATRDASGLREMGYPTFARGSTPRNYHYPVSAEYGAVNVPVVCGGVLVNPGDVLIGDDDGIVVVPQGVAAEVAATILEDLSAERKMRSSMERFEPFAVEEELRERGYRFT